MKLKRQITISSAYDKRSEDPKKNYGIGSCRIYFAVIGEDGAITVNFFTNWYLPSTIKEYAEEGIFINRLDGIKDKFKTQIDLLNTKETIYSGSWDYHSKKKKHKYLTKLTGCEFTGGDCYGEGSCLRADDYLKLLFEKGSEGVFEKLEEDYKEEFKVKK